MQIFPRCCCVRERAPSLSSVQHQHLPGGAQKNGRRTAKERKRTRGRGDILDKSSNKTMLMIESRRWRMSDIGERTVEIWQRVCEESCSRFFLMYHFHMLRGQWRRAEEGEHPRMPRKEKTWSTAGTTGKLYAFQLTDGNKGHPEDRCVLMDEDEKQL